MLKTSITYILLICTTVLCAQRFETEKTSVTADPKSTYKKYKRLAEKSGQPLDKEKYAAVLKFYYEIDQSNEVFSDVLADGSMTEDGQVEYLQTLARNKAWSRFAIVNSIRNQEVKWSEENANLVRLLSRLEEGSTSEEPKVKECYTFDARETLQGGNDLDIYWLIDGKKKKGAVVEKCFQEAGEYSITLSNSTFKKGEELTDTTFVIQVKAPPVFEWASIAKQVLKGQKISLVNPVIESGEGYEVLWSMGNGTYFTGGERTYAFPVAGNFQVKQYLIPSPESNKPIVSHVTTVAVID